MFPSRRRAQVHRRNSSWLVHSTRLSLASTSQTPSAHFSPKPPSPQRSTCPRRLPLPQSHHERQGTDWSWRSCYRWETSFRHIGQCRAQLRGGTTRAQPAGRHANKSSTQGSENGVHSPRFEGTPSGRFSRSQMAEPQSELPPQTCVQRLAGGVVSGLTRTQYPSSTPWIPQSSLLTHSRDSNESSPSQVVNLGRQ